MRADLYLTENGHVSSRQRAKDLIEKGLVAIDGVTLKKPSQPIDAGEHRVEIHDDLPYVSRGGLKLAGALEHFGVSPKGKRALDIGASTGGFTDCLLQGGAVRVCAVDAGQGQLVDRLANDVRVTSLEHTNARGLTLEMIGGARVDLIVMDVSFISATYILPRFPALLSEGGEAICLIKPQFEVGRSMLGKGGIVRDAAAHKYAVERVLESATALGLTPVGLMPSPIEGGDGNREFLVHLTYQDNSREPLSAQEIARVTASRREGR